MVFHKRTFRRRRFRRSFKRRHGVRKIRRIVRASVKRMAETKVYTSLVNIAIDNTGPFFGDFVNGIAQGTGYSDRIGNRIQVKRMTMHLNATMTNRATTVTTALETTSALRIVIFFPRKGLSTSTIQSLLTQTNPGINGRFDPSKAIVLYDKLFRFGVGANFTAGVITLPTHSGSLPSFIKFRFSKKTRMLLNYTVANLIDVKPLIYIVCVSNPYNAVTNASSVFVDGYLSTSFIDM